MEADKKLKPGRDALPVMESFYTLQGEGLHTGLPSWFIRLGGCDIGCHWCDVKDSWDAAAHPLLSIDQIVEEAVGSGVKNIVITGGEPFMYDMRYLCNSLLKMGLKLHVETSGAYPISGRWDWICVSPKKFKPVLQDSLDRADEIKVIVYNQSDLEWSLQFEERIRPDTRKYLQVEWSKRKKMNPEIIRWCQQHPDWSVSTQVHKYLGLP